MFKLIKYIFKGEYKSIVFINVLFCILSITMLVKSNIMFQASNSMELDGVKIGGTFAILFLLCLFFYFLTFIQSIYSFSKSLNSNSRYLLLSIPKKGYSLLGSNLLASVIKIIITAFTTLCVLALYYFTVGKKIIPDFVYNNISFLNILLALLLCLFIYTFLLLVIYFSILLRKSIIKNKSFGKYITLLISIIVFATIIKCNSLILDFTSKAMHLNLVESIYMKSNDFIVNIPNISINIAFIAFNIILFVLLYILSSYVLEHKSDI